MLMQHGFEVTFFAGVIEIQNTTIDEVINYLIKMVNNVPNETELACVLLEQQKHIEKYDEYISEPLLSEGYGKKAFDSFAAKQWILCNF